MASAADIAKALEGLIGSNDDEATVDTFLDTGYAPLNYALSSRWDGGLAVGRQVEIAGPSTSGKTAIATRAMIAAQKMGGIAGFMDHERSFSGMLAQRIGLDTTPGRFLYKKPRTFEDSLTLAVKAGELIRTKKLIAPEAPICLVFDSLASMVPQSALIDMKTGKDKDMTDRNMNDNTALARATSAHLPAFNLYIEELGICAIFTNQIRMKIGVVYGDPRKTPGGEAPYFYDTQKLMLGAASKITKGTGENAEVLGVEVQGVVAKNKVSRPFLKASWRFVFQPDGFGKFDIERSLIEFLVKEKLLEDKGQGRVLWDGKAVHKETLARKIEAANALSELHALLPKAYEPPVVAEADLTGETEAEELKAAA
jgi:protein RecA